MPPSTDEFVAVKTELEGDLKEAVTGLRSDLKELKHGLSGLVTTRECAARHEAEQAHRRHLAGKIEATEQTILSAVAAVRSEVAASLNGRIEEKIEEKLDEKLDEKLPGKILDTTERLDTRKLRQRPQSGMFKKLGDGAKSLTAIITLSVMLVGGCITGSYYLAGIATVVRQAAEAARGAASRQETLLKKQEVAIKQLENPPQMVSIAPPYVPSEKPAAKRPHRTVAKRAAGGTGNASQ